MKFSKIGKHTIRCVISEQEIQDLGYTNILKCNETQSSYSAASFSDNSLFATDGDSNIEIPYFSRICALVIRNTSRLHQIGS